MSTEERSVEMVNELPSSIEVNRGMKGDVGWSIKIRGADGDEFDIVDRIAAIDAALSIRFRKPNPTLEEQLGASIAEASEPVSSDPNVPYVGSRAATVDKRVGETVVAKRLAAEIEKATRSKE